MLPDLAPVPAPAPASAAGGSNKTSPRGTSLTSQSLPALPAAKKGFKLGKKLSKGILGYAKAQAASDAAATAAEATSSATAAAAVEVSTPAKSTTAAVPNSSDSAAHMDTPTGDALIAAGDTIESPFREGVDEHINQFLDDMENA
jgi:hypothetical protein